jgi:hypothetical protein
LQKSFSYWEASFLSLFWLASYINLSCCPAKKMAVKIFFGLFWAILMMIFVGTTSGERRTAAIIPNKTALISARTGTFSQRCPPVIFHFTDDQLLEYFHRPSRQIKMSQKDIELQKERTFACGCSSYMDDADTNIFLRPQWLDVAFNQQTLSWAISPWWKYSSVQVRQVSYLTSLTSGQYTCGYVDGKKISMEILLMPAPLLSTQPVVEACQPEIFLQDSKATNVNQNTRPLNSQYIQAVNGRRFADIRCRCVGPSNVSQANLYWQRNGIEITNQSFATSRIFNNQSDGPVISLTITMDSRAYRSTFTCRSGPSKFERITLDVLCKANSKSD